MCLKDFLIQALNNINLANILLPPIVNRRSEARLYFPLPDVAPVI